MNHLILGDVHGNLPALREVLDRSGAVIDGRKAPDWEIYCVGDLANMGPAGVAYRGQIRDDEGTLRFALDLDMRVIVGNHEIYYTHNLECGRWHGMADVSQLTANTVSYMREFVNRGEYVAAYAVNGWLVTHAGIHPRFIKEEVETLSVDEIAADLNRRLIDAAIREDGYSNGVIHGIGPYSGGGFPYGGIFWLRPQEWAPKYESPIPQIYGHTPQENNPRYVEVRNAWQIDNGECGAIRWTEGSSGWEIV